MNASEFLVTLASSLLPPADRFRYRCEFEADLAALPAPRRLAHVLSLLLGAPALRWALLRDGAGRTSVRCFVGLHSERIVHPNPENQTVVAKRCVRCGRQRDPRQYEGVKHAEGLAWGNPFIRGGG